MFHPAESLPENYLSLYTHHILRSLIHAQPLVTEIPDTQPFDPTSLTLPETLSTLNFRQKLGHLYEDALTILLDHSTRYKLITNNLQIHHQKTTLGELDYIIRDTHTDQYLHLELAIKFYLAHPSANNQITYPGPDARDNFHRKLNRLTTHQLHLTNHPATQEILSQKHNITSILPAHLIHGIIHTKNPHTPLPNETSPAATVRPYTALTDLPPLMPQIRIIPKPLWFCPPETEWLNTLSTTSLADLQKIATNRVTLIHSDIHPTPTFITPPTWPNHRNSSAKPKA